MASRVMTVDSQALGESMSAPSLCARRKRRKASWTMSSASLSCSRSRGRWRTAAAESPRTPPYAASRARSSRQLGSAHRFLHELADLCLFGGGQLLQRKVGWPHGAFVEVRRVVEAERRVPRLEFVR